MNRFFVSEQWKKNHQEELPILESNLKGGFEANAVFITNGKFGDNPKPMDFYINEVEMLTYVVNGDNIVTCYPIDFGLDDIGNKEMLNVLLKNAERNKEMLNKYYEEDLEDRRKHYSEIEELNLEIEVLQSQIKTKNAEKDRLKALVDTIDRKMEECKTTIDLTNEKIVRSKLAI